MRRREHAGPFGLAEADAAAGLILGIVGDGMPNDARQRFVLVFVGAAVSEAVAVRQCIRRRVRVRLEQAHGIVVLR